MRDSNSRTPCGAYDLARRCNRPLCQSSVVWHAVMESNHLPGVRSAWAEIRLTAYCFGRHDQILTGLTSFCRRVPSHSVTWRVHWMWHSAAVISPSLVLFHISTLVDRGRIELRSALLAKQARVTFTTAQCYGSQCWDRTNDLLLVRELRYRCANRPMFGIACGT